MYLWAWSRLLCCVSVLFLLGCGGRFVGVLVLIVLSLAFVGTLSLLCVVFFSSSPPVSSLSFLYFFTGLSPSNVCVCCLMLFECIWAVLLFCVL